jgi:hypothetical protein
MIVARTQVPERSISSTPEAGHWTIAQPIDFSLQRDWKGRQPFLVAETNEAAHASNRGGGERNASVSAG